VAGELVREQHVGGDELDANFALCFLAAASAAANCGESLRLPLSTFTNSAASVHFPPFK
jgi:hypothetical protein